MKHKNIFQHIYNAFLYSCAGLKATFKSEIAFRQDICICSILFLIALCLPVSLTLKLLMIISLFFILIAELINTAIETVVNRISTDIHPLSKKAKDIGSAIVFFSFIQVIIVYSTILISLIF
jgi:diacylglycerol kinase (ATP)